MIFGDARIENGDSLAAACIKKNLGKIGPHNGGGSCQHGWYRNILLND